jgi:hypothetical protein
LAPTSEQEQKEIDNERNDAIVDISSVEIPMHGQTLLYPSDWYYFTSYVDVEVTGLSLFHNEKDGLHFGFFLPLDLQVAPPTSQMAGTKLSCGQERWIAVTDDVRSFDLVVIRSSQVKWFVYGVALMPLVLSLLLAYMLFFSPTHQNLGNEAFTRDSILAVAGVVIAILPLRTVLVPSEVQGLSRVDFILGAELVMIVCLALIGYARHIWRTG